MKKAYYIFVILVLVMLLPCTVYSQAKTSAKTRTVTSINKATEKQFTRWSIKGGLNLSVIYLARNTKDNNNTPGYCGGFVYEINDFIRLAGLYTHFKPINIEPTWLNVNASTSEINLEALAKFPNKKTLLYPFIGLSYNTYKGFFTGESDYLGLREYYKVNSTVRNQWLGLNMGAGVEHNFGMLGIFIDYRMRVGKQEQAINIMDVCYTAGLKLRFPYGKIAKSLAKPNDRFHWF